MTAAPHPSTRAVPRHLIAQLPAQAEAGLPGTGRPLVVRPDGRVLVDPAREDLLQAAGTATRDLTTT